MRKPTDIPTTLPWGLNLGDGQPRHPVAIYEIIFLILLWSFIGWIERKGELRTGAAFKIFMIAYLLFRFHLTLLNPIIILYWTFYDTISLCRRSYLLPQGNMVSGQMFLKYKRTNA